MKKRSGVRKTEQSGKAVLPTISKLLEEEKPAPAPVAPAPPPPPAESTRRRAMRIAHAVAISLAVMAGPAIAQELTAV